jgi:hypothetical protein
LRLKSAFGPDYSAAEEKKMNRSLLKIAAVPIAFLVIGIVGIILSLPSSQLWFGLIFVAINIFVTVFLVDRLIKYRREQQWANVRSITLSAIVAHLCDIASDIYLEFSAAKVDLSSLDRILKGRNTPNAATPDAFEEFADELSNIHKDIRGESPSTIVADFYKKIQWDLDQIQNVLTPLVITSSSEQRLIDALVSFNQTQRELINGIRSHQMAGTQEAFPALVALVRGSGRLYATMATYLEAGSSPEKKE